MKNYILYLVLFCFSITLFSQEETEEKESLFTNKHEVSIYFSNILTKQEFTMWPYYYYYYDYDDLYYLQLLQSQPIYGIGYKYHFTKGALRLSLGGSYDKAKQDFEDDDDYPYIRTSEDEYSYMYGNINFGYEFHKNMKHVQFYYGIDGIFKLHDFKLKSESEQVYTLDPLYNTTSKSENKSKRTSYGFAPVIGIKYYVSESISFGIETKISCLFYKGTTKYKYSSFSYGGSSNSSDEKIDESGFNTEFGPLSHISICIHF